MLFFWVSCNIKKIEKFLYDIDGDCVYEVSYDFINMMSSSKMGVFGMFGIYLKEVGLLVLEELYYVEEYINVRIIYVYIFSFMVS